MTSVINTIKMLYIKINETKDKDIIFIDLCDYKNDKCILICRYNPNGKHSIYVYGKNKIAKLTEATENSITLINGNSLLYGEHYADFNVYTKLIIDKYHQEG